MLSIQVDLSSFILW